LAQHPIKPSSPETHLGDAYDASKNVRLSGEAIIIARFSIVAPSGKPFRLAGDGENGTPPAARRIEALLVGSHEFDWGTGETLVKEADDKTGRQTCQT
jgi:hypothetical protein